MIKIHIQLRTYGNLLNLKECLQESKNPQQTSFHHGIRTETKAHLPTVLFNVILEVLSSVKNKENK